MLLQPSLYTVKGLAILDNNGNRILAKYFDEKTFPTSKEQKTFESSLFAKTRKANSDILMLDGLTVVYKSNVDLFFYVMGGGEENELMLLAVLNCLFDSISQVLRKNVEKRSLCENMDVVMLVMDEICDRGVVMESDSASVVARAAIRAEDTPLGEQTLTQVLQSAKEQLKWSLLK